MARNRDLTVTAEIFDALSFARALEAAGLLRQHAEAIAGGIAGVAYKITLDQTRYLATKDDVLKLQGDMADLKTVVVVVRKDVERLKADFADLKADVAQLKIDVAELKTTVVVLRNDVEGLKTDFAESKKEFKAEIAELKTDVAALNDKITDLKNDLFRALRILGVGLMGTFTALMAAFATLLR